MGTIFETDTCSRCGGTGKFSFNYKDGTMCYGCNGTGKKKTKKGIAAYNFFIASLEKNIKDIKPGYLLEQSGRWLEIESMGKSTCVLEDGWIEFNFTNNTGLNSSSEDGGYTCIKDKNEFQELRLKAIEYQNKLTKQGKLMKKYQ